ncbi:MAG: hypothetical protein ABIJ96_13525 [Elusimicrobiota bacterium]
MIPILVLGILLALPAAALDQSVPVEGSQVAPLRESPAPPQVQQNYLRAVERYNAEVMRTGSAIGREAIRLKEDMDALRKRSEELRGERPPAALPAPTETAEVEEFRLPEQPKSRTLYETMVTLGVVTGLALIGYGVGWGGKAKRKAAHQGKTAVIKCPGCGKKLRVPQRGKRVRVRCPECGRESAYNPAKKK